MPTPPRNPYIAGKALADSRGFFGREDIFRVVETVLSSPDQNSVVLFGQRRIGKTSILLNLRSRLSSSGFVPVYFDLMDRARKSLAQVTFELAVTIAQELQLPQPAPADFDDEGRSFREKFLPTVYTTLGEQKRLVLLFDEFDVLDTTQEEQLPIGAAARTFFPYLRELMTEEPRLGYVFVVGRKASDLSIDVKATFKAARYQRVSVLDEDAAKELAGISEREGLLRWSNEAVAHVLALTARHPYFTQLICQLLFEVAYTSEPPRVEIVPADVDAIVPKVLEAGENVFEWIWDGLPPAERVIFSAIASGTDEQTVITEDRLMSILQTQGIRILIRELELAPKTLVEWEMLKQTDGGYKFFVELMRRWVVTRKPLGKVKDELDRVVPLADMLYQAANGFYRRSNLDQAVTQLQNALNINPNHLKAHLLLGEIYRTQGKFDNAVSELEDAYKIDEDGTHFALATVLLQRARASENENRVDDALRDYNRVLAISPKNVAAKDRRASIWIQRGEEAMRAKFFDVAREAFKEAGTFDRLSEVEKMERKHEFERLADLAENLAGQEKWEDVVATYERLIELDGEDKHWQEGLAQAQKEQQIANRYTEGLGAMQQKKWSEAQRAFADVVYSRPDYKDAAKQLYRAIHPANGKYEFAERSLSLFAWWLKVVGGGAITGLWISAWLGAGSSGYFPMGFLAVSIFFVVLWAILSGIGILIRVRHLFSSWVFLIVMGYLVSSLVASIVGQGLVGYWPWGGFIVSTLLAYSWATVSGIGMLLQK